MAGDKFLDVVKQRFCVAGKERVVGIVGIFNIFGTRDLRRQVAASFDGHLSIGSTMQHERRSTHGSEVSI